MKKTKVNERIGEVVCICEKNGNISMFDPGAWRRARAIKKEKTGERKRNDDR